MAQQVSRKPVFPPEIAPYIDVAAYLLDARAPAATLYFDQLLAGKELVLLTRAGQAEARVTARWQRFLAEAGYPCLVVDSLSGQGFSAVLDYLAELLQKKLALARRRGLAAATLRVSSLGVPNVGKSTFLNRLIGGRRLKTGDRPGITRGHQWVRLFEDVEVLDTPGILRDPEALNRRKPYWMLLNLMPYDTALREEAVELLRSKLSPHGWKQLLRSYKASPKAGARDDVEPELLGGADEAEQDLMDDADSVQPGSLDAEAGGATGLPDCEDWLQLLWIVAKGMGFALHDDEMIERAARRLLRDFQQGRFGRLSLQHPETDSITSPLFGKRQPA